MPSLREWHGTPLADTGQEFTPEAVVRVVELTAGQPWLVNALAYEVVVKMKVPASDPVTADSQVSSQGA